MAKPGLVTCSANLFSGATLTMRGFFTSRGVVPPAKTSSRLLCKSYGGTFATGPDKIGFLANPVLWVCNDFFIPDDIDSFFYKLDALGIDCFADGGSELGAIAISGPFAYYLAMMDTTCYGPA